MNKKGLYAFSIHGVCNYMRKIFIKETFVKYCIIHSFIKLTMAVITVNTEEIKAVALFKDNNNRIDYLITHMEGAV